MFQRPIRTFNNENKQEQEEESNVIDIVLVGTFNSKKVPKIGKAELVLDSKGQASGLTHDDQDAIAVFQENWFIGFIPRAIISYFKNNSITLKSAEITESTKYVKARLKYDICNQ